MATAGDQINRALRLLGVLAEGETPSSDTSADALLALNQMLDSWSTERLSVYTTLTQTFTWPSGERTRTLGPSGDFAGVRPIALDTSTYYVYNQISYPIEIVNQMEYNSIALKTAQSTLPSVLYVDTAMENVSISIYSVPTTDLEFHFVSVLPLNQADNLSSDLVFPPGYLRAFTYNLACELAPEFGVEPSATVQRIAMSSKRNIKRINNPVDLMGMPGAILPRPTVFNIYTGMPQ